MPTQRSAPSQDHPAPVPAEPGTLAALRERLHDLAPRSVLVIGSLPELDTAALFSEPTTVHSIATDATAALASLGLSDLALVGGALETLSRRDGEMLLASLRDLYARRCVIRLCACEHWTDHDLIAFGFHRLASADDDVQFLGFDIATYKPTPDWLNADHWANPQLFDRFRW